MKTGISTSLRRMEVLLALWCVSSLLDNSAVTGYCKGFAGVPGLTPECFFACAIRSSTLFLPS